MLNPEYIAKSYYPERVLKYYGLKAVGSKLTLVTPEKRSRDRVPEEAPTTNLFVAGATSNFRRLLADIERGSIEEAVKGDLTALEQINSVDARAKIKGKFADLAISPLEVVLHASEFRSDLYIIEAFQEYVASLGLEADLEHRFHAGGSVLPAYDGSDARCSAISRNSLTSVRYERCRACEPVSAAQPKGESPRARNASDGARSRSEHSRSDFRRWDTRRYHSELVGYPLQSRPGSDSVQEALDHGYAVTSAISLGFHKPGEASPPFANVDDIRVWDVNSGADPLELDDVLERIKKT